MYSSPGTATSLWLDLRTLKNKRRTQKNDMKQTRESSIPLLRWPLHSTFLKLEASIYHCVSLHHVRSSKLKHLLAAISRPRPIPANGCIEHNIIFFWIFYIQIGGSSVVTSDRTILGGSPQLKFSAHRLFLHSRNSTICRITLTHAVVLSSTQVWNEYIFVIMRGCHALFKFCLASPTLMM